MKLPSSPISLFTFFLSVLTLLPILLIAFAPLTVSPAYASGTIDIWWPTDGSHLSGVQPFKAMLEGQDASTYSMYWQVDGGQQNIMPTNTTDAPHKEATVDLTNWNWQPSGAYTLTFTAKDNSGNVIATQNVTIHLPVSGTPATTTATSTQSATTIPLPFYVTPNSDAAQQALTWSGDHLKAAAMNYLASKPTATWFGDWNTSIENDVAQVVSAAKASSTIPVLVAYNIPNRDCGGYSAGGTSAYTPWITSFAEGIGKNPALVILEPDALADISCLSSSDQAERLSLLSQAVSILKQNPQTKVYIDAGHANWIDAATMAQELQQANIAQADGFSLNISNFDTTSNEIIYGTALSKLVGNKHFVIDTSRNGNGPDTNNDWCNPSGRAVGVAPTTATGNALVDAFLWIKIPGESDGECNGGPSAGTWWAEYALQLVQNANLF